MTVGIDVGGARKGFHAVALRDGRYADQHASRDPQAIARWCVHACGARVIAIDAPSCWSADGRMRPGERELLGEGIPCFASPSRQQALAHPTNYFGWMFCGEALYQALAATHPLCSGLPLGGAACFETFPHAITWHLQGGQADASRKRSQRAALLVRAGIPCERLTSMDWMDAALCALAAHQLATGAPMRTYGEPRSGLILVPAPPPGAGG